MFCLAAARQRRWHKVPLCCEERLGAGNMCNSQANVLCEDVHRDEQMHLESLVRFLADVKQQGVQEKRNMLKINRRLCS